MRLSSKKTRSDIPDLINNNRIKEFRQGVFLPALAVVVVVCFFDFLLFSLTCMKMLLVVLHLLLLSIYLMNI